MKDKLGRDITYLRVSVTKKCNLNCSYCGSKKDSPQKELSADEITALVEAFAHKGINKVRLTGGEPLMREDITEIARRIKAIDGIEALYLTTNGILLEKYAPQLISSGVDGVNISLDTLDSEVFRRLTGVNKLGDVIKGINKALEEGFSSVKINTVLVKGKNDGEALEIMKLARDNKLDVRFIELMPFSKQGENGSLVVTTDELIAKAPFLEPCENAPGDTAKYYKAEGFKGRIGFISPRTHKFCSSCNRIRLLSDGRVKPCLGNNLTYELLPFMDDKELLSEKITQAILNKPCSHHFEDGEKFRGLNLIGG